MTGNCSCGNPTRILSTGECNACYKRRGIAEDPEHHEKVKRQQNLREDTRSKSVNDFWWSPMNIAQILEQVDTVDRGLRKTHCIGYANGAFFLGQSNCPEPHGAPINNSNQLN